jgi:hypothetical protein
MLAIRKSPMKNVMTVMTLRLRLIGSTRASLAASRATGG